jgi:hypothetical protein
VTSAELTAPAGSAGSRSVCIHICSSCPAGWRFGTGESAKAARLAEDKKKEKE